MCYALAVQQVHIVGLLTAYLSFVKRFSHVLTCSSFCCARHYLRSQPSSRCALYPRSSRETLSVCVNIVSRRGMLPDGAYSSKNLGHNSLFHLSGSRDAHSITLVRYHHRRIQRALDRCCAPKYFSFYLAHDTDKNTNAEHIRGYS